ERDHVDPRLVLGRVLRPQVTVAEVDRRRAARAHRERLVLRRPRRRVPRRPDGVTQLELVDPREREPLLLRDPVGRAHAVVPLPTLIGPEARAAVLAHARLHDVAITPVEVDRREEAVRDGALLARSTVADRRWRVADCRDVADIVV